MSWLLFLDESGHDHKSTPYEVHGGFAIHATKLWSFISQVRVLEQATSGTDLRGFGMEIKGSKLLRPRCFKWAEQVAPMDEASRRKHTLNFLNNGKQGRQPRAVEFAAYGQACLTMAERVIQLLRSHEARIFAAIIPRTSKPLAMSTELLRKDLVFLLERYFYFLESVREMGLLIMDGTDKHADQKIVRTVERYFTEAVLGRQRTQWVVPVPFFVESDMAYGVQAADLCIYCMNWGLRLPQMTEPKRTEIEPYAGLLKQIIWYGDGYRDKKVFKTWGVVYVPDPYAPRTKPGNVGA